MSRFTVNSTTPAPGTLKLCDDTIFEQTKIHRKKFLCCSKIIFLITR